jgi:hypothetical protein
VASLLLNALLSIVLVRKRNWSYRGYTWAPAIGSWASRSDPTERIFFSDRNVFIYYRAGVDQASGFWEEDGGKIRLFSCGGEEGECSEYWLSPTTTGKNRLRIEGVGPWFGDLELVRARF